MRLTWTDQFACLLTRKFINCVLSILCVSIGKRYLSGKLKTNHEKVKNKVSRNNQETIGLPHWVDNPKFLTNISIN